MSAPPSSSCGCSTSPPHHTADAAAKSTSVSITTEAVLTGRCEAPYCRARLPATNTSPMPSAPSSQPGAGAGGHGKAPCNASTAPSTHGSIQPPMNIAAARACGSCSASRRNHTLVKAKPMPPSTPSASGRLPS